MALFDLNEKAQPEAPVKPGDFGALQRKQLSDASLAMQGEVFKEQMSDFSLASQLKRATAAFAGGKPEQSFIERQPSGAEFINFAMTPPIYSEAAMRQADKLLKRV
jgi:hypothetical protein